MSKVGRLTRGMKWWMFRNIDGDLPREIAEDPGKMEDVNLYLNFIEGKNSKTVNKQIEKIRYLNRNNAKGRKQLIKDTTEELFGLKKIEPKEEVKKPETKENKK